MKEIVPTVLKMREYKLPKRSRQNKTKQRRRKKEKGSI
jgi:hypothetical protein